ncbi:MAG TPA: molybdopterin cofactor-binding domain-containing protein [Allosphingosinicella sp.]|nr:molybdopterin cofactor-binding domain-containing protein [Allosphingosinicella sp.]
MARTPPMLSRRTLLIGGGASAGLVLAWAVWPRRYAPNLPPAEGEQLLNAFVKIGRDGRVVVAVPQAELGQGSWTALAQILGDELGADWRAVGVEAAPIGPLYANPLLAAEPAEGFLDGIERWREQRLGDPAAAMLTGGSTSVRAFERPLRDAGAAARALLMRAAARRWDLDWRTLDTAAGFVGDGQRRLSFGELAADAAKEEVPEHLPIRAGIANRLTGVALPRLDVPAKLDGSAPFAGDIRLPEMLFASVRAGPDGASRLKSIDKEAARRVAGLAAIVERPGWVAAVADTWWAANRALDALRLTWNFRTAHVDSAFVDRALVEALERDEGERVFSRGDIAEAFATGNVLRGHYRAGPAASAPLETLTATARFDGETLEIWAPVQAPALARAAAARAADLPEASVVLYRTLIGGGYGRKLETRGVEQAAAIAVELKRPVQLTWSRLEEIVQDSFRPAARGQILARLAEGGMIAGWKARIAAPDGGEALADRLGGGRASRAFGAPTTGAVPPYQIPNLVVDHLPADTGIRVGAWRSGAHSYTNFFTESFVDELSRIAGVEPLSFRMQMLGDNPRLARCLTTAATLGGWDGGGAGGAMGIACCSAYGSHIATLVEIELTAAQDIRVLRAVCAVDVGRVVNPEIVKQQIEGGLIFGVEAATANPIEFDRGRPTARSFGDLGFPRLDQAPEVSVEIMESDESPGGATELAVPTAAPAIANALHSMTGRRLRALPLRMSG